jgi:hypothetical protein
MAIFKISVSERFRGYRTVEKIFIADDREQAQRIAHDTVGPWEVRDEWKGGEIEDESLEELGDRGWERIGDDRDD